MHRDSEDIPLRNGESPLTGNTSKPSKSIEPWNIIHTANNSYTGFIQPRTCDTHQWLPLQFVNYSWWWTQTASETCRVIKNQINRKSCIALVFYKTSITKMHGTMNIKFWRNLGFTWCTLCAYQKNRLWNKSGIYRRNLETYSIT